MSARKLLLTGQQFLDTLSGNLRASWRANKTNGHNREIVFCTWQTPPMAALRGESIIVRTGAPVSGLLRAEAELAVDLVVMSTHGRTGKKHTLLGSVTEQVVCRSICPVLTTRPR